MTDLEIFELIQYTVILWPNQRDMNPRDQIIGWRPLLADVDADAARAVVDEYAADAERFPPPPGLIRQRAVLLVDDSGAPTPEQAWEEVGQKIQTIGYFATTVDFCHLGRGCPGPTCEHHVVRFSHPAIQAVVDSMGWRELCLSSEVMADRAHFMKFYASAVDRLARQVVKPPSMVAVETSRLAELGPPPAPVRALPSQVVDEQVRDDEEGIAQIRSVREAIAAATKRVDEVD